MSTPTRIVYGKAAADGIADVLGYAAADNDLAIEETADETITTEDGNTAKVEVYNPGKQATGTLVIPRASVGKGKNGMIVQIAYRNAPASFRPYRVTAWKEQKDGETGLAVAEFTALSEDSMVEEYNLGPRDPETGELIGNKKKIVFNWEAGYLDPTTKDGTAFGLFTSSVAGPTDHTSEVDKSKAVLADAAATATMENGQCIFFAPVGTYYVASLAENGQAKAYTNDGLSSITVSASATFFADDLVETDWYTA